MTQEELQKAYDDLLVKHNELLTKQATSTTEYNALMIKLKENELKVLESENGLKELAALKVANEKKEVDKTLSKTIIEKTEEPTEEIASFRNLKW